MHGRVLLPVPVTSGVRCLVYRFFVFNTPFSVFDVIQILRFRLLFVYDSERTSVKIEELRLHPYSGGPSFYREDDNLWTYFFVFAF